MRLSGPQLDVSRGGSHLLSPPSLSSQCPHSGEGREATSECSSSCAHGPPCLFSPRGSMPTLSARQMLGHPAQPWRQCIGVGTHLSPAPSIAMGPKMLFGLGCSYSEQSPHCMGTSCLAQAHARRGYQRGPQCLATMCAVSCSWQQGCCPSWC